MKVKKGNYLILTFNDLPEREQEAITADINQRLIDEGVLDDDLPDAVEYELSNLEWNLNY